MLALMRTVRETDPGCLILGRHGINESAGGGSDRRRKNSINSAIGRRGLFEDLLNKFKNNFYRLADDLQSDVQAAVRTHLDVIRNSLDILRSENAALESEQDPEFRGRVEAEVGRVK